MRSSLILFLVLPLAAEPQSVEHLQSAAATARRECRWTDSLSLLEKARGLARNRKLLRQLEEETLWIETARKYASPDLHCEPQTPSTPPPPIHQVWPDPPPRSSLPRGQRKVYIWAEVSHDGIPSNLHVVPIGIAGPLAEEALKAVAQWRFQPAIAAGKPVRVPARIETGFKGGR